MNFKSVATRWGLTLLLCLFSFILIAQTSPESSQNVVVLQKGKRERTIELGDFVRIQKTGEKRKTKGELAFVTDSSLTIRGQVVPISSIEKISVGKRTGRRLAFWCLLGFFIAPTVFGLLVWGVLGAFRLDPVSINARGWSRVLLWFNNARNSLLLLGIGAAIFCRRIFKLRKWKIKVEKE